MLSDRSLEESEERRKKDSFQEGNGTSPSLELVRMIDHHTTSLLKGMHKEQAFFMDGTKRKSSINIEET